MSIRNDILNKFVDVIKTNCSSVKQVTRQFKLITDFRPFELPAVCVLDGDMTFEEIDRCRTKCIFTVIIRIVVHDTEHVSDKLNNVLSEVVSALMEHKTLDGVLHFPLRIVAIDTDEGWLHPFSVADIRVETAFVATEHI